MDVVTSGCQLSLRGGGASAKRKEARKRKYHELAELPANTSPKRKASTINAVTELLGTPSAANQKASKEHNDTPATNDASPRQKVADIQRESPDLSSRLGRPKHQHFVVFIGKSPPSFQINLRTSIILVVSGNLPYSATDQSIQRHFASLKPTSIRHRRNKGNGTSKGFAFIEFRNYDHMKTCLEKFHQSFFEDGISPGRKLNVELT